MNEFKPENILKENVDLATMESLPIPYIEDKVVLGLDIYRYSQYPSIQQIYIPVIFERLYYMTMTDIKKNEPYLFSEYGNNLADYKKKFISTGDGGFQIFDNVLQAVVFALYFQVFLKRFCTGGSLNEIDKNLFKLVDTIDLRFAISRDKIYSYKSNYFGPAIINNARILSKDSLNRLLIDSNSIKWLSRTINAPENLIDINKKSLSKTMYFKDYDKSQKSFLFDESDQIVSVDIQKVGALKAKETKLDIYNMHVQARINVKVEHQDYSIYMVSLGNLNTTGITE